MFIISVLIYTTHVNSIKYVKLVALHSCNLKCTNEIILDNSYFIVASKKKIIFLKQLNFYFIEKMKSNILKYIWKKAKQNKT